MATNHSAIIESSSARHWGGSRKAARPLEADASRGAGRPARPIKAASQATAPVTPAAASATRTTASAIPATTPAAGAAKAKRRPLPRAVWLAASLLLAIGAWSLMSLNAATADSFPSLIKVAQAIGDMYGKGVLLKDIGSSLLSVLGGFVLGFALALPTSILMAWYKPVENLIGPWIQFIRSIPPLAYVPLVVMSAGIGTKAQIIVIMLATFLVMTVTIYQGVVNVDPLLIKAAKVLGARDRDLFVHIIVPAVIPYIVTAVRLGATTALTTLIAAESTGAVAGLGMRIQSLSQNFDTAPMVLYIIIVGIIGVSLDQGSRAIERRVTTWQEK
ncbi:ABC transporter permease [Lacticaseibacillus parakribbianus]|uniref:ABC transporter permease n=1 Tax=Lacticaseibacillus parakribbianus TaxID=2970927 RepID=UPI0021CB655A|nr:ABC transporter permease [Lacticaseibacillus parakribbianus]